MGNIWDAQIPAARWAEPEDSDKDIHFSRFELWVNDLFERQEQYELGFLETLTLQWIRTFLFDIYMDDYKRSKGAVNE
jgi:hypothetical protein